MELNSNDSPTWYDPIKDLFRKKDRACMLERFDLAKYEDVKKSASHIYGVLKNKWMPMGGPYWSDEQLLVLENWIKNGCPMGEPKNTPSKFMKLFSLEKVKESKVTAARIRKNLNELSDNEIKKLKTAFDGIKKLPNDDPNSFFHLASFHGLPNPIWCWHHFFGFLPWHRYYVLIFENALRTIKGCEDVTLPYWDLVSEKPLPEWIWQDPFDSFTYPIDMPSDDPQVGPSTKHPKTIRASYKYVTNTTVINGYRDWVGESMKTSTWEDFADYQNPSFGYRVALEKTHDSIHNLTGGVLSNHPDGIEIPGGGDMALQEFTAFDPIFWFFHNGIDRYCWEWQKQRDAKDVIGLTKTFKTGSLSDLYLKQPLNPWLSETFEKYVNLETLKVGNDLGIDYTPGSFSRDDSLLLRLSSLPKTFISPSQSFSISPQYIVSIKSVNRTFIQGSFSVLLYYHDDNKKVIVGSESCFQPQNPMKCKGCNEKPILDFGFQVSKDLIDKKFSFEIHTLDQKVISLHRVGSPFIQITSTLQSF